MVTSLSRGIRVQTELAPDEMKYIIMHPPRGPKGRGVAPIGATRGVH